MVCLDTSFIIALIRRDPRAEKKLQEITEADLRLTITPITMCELFEGAYKASRKTEEIRKVRSLAQRIEMLEFSLSVCERYGRLIRELDSKGTPIGDLDTLIASLAISHNEALLTRNVEHFEKVPALMVESW